ncbi:MAG: type II secretion system F family protein [Pseudomonadota bacterium]
MELLLDIVFSEYFALVLIFFGIFIVSFYLMPDEAKILAQQRLGVDTGKKEYRYSLLKYAAILFPLFLPSIMALKVDKYRAKRKKILISAGMSDQLDPNEFISFKCVTVLFALGASSFYFGTSGAEIPYGKIILITIIGWFVPNIWISGIKKKRHKIIFRTLPYFMDLLTLSVEAGLDFIAAITRIIQKSKDNPLVDEFQAMLKEIKLGTNRSDALGNMAQRIHLSEFSSLTTVLIQADELGASIGPVLRAQSELLRTQRFQKAEKKGAEASQKILIPMILLILPTIAIVIFGPMILRYFYMGGL